MLAVKGRTLRPAPAHGGDPLRLGGVVELHGRGVGKGHFPRKVRGAQGP